MKKIIAPFLGVALCLFLISWGSKGHKAIATIAYNHLNFNVIPFVQNTLHGQSMSDVGSWADEARNDPEFRETAPWHFVNVPLGLNFRDFEKAVKNDPNPNIYFAILKCEDDLRQKDLDPAKKEIALKFLIHLVGDAHQPMHVSRREDKGGNTIQVRFDGKGSNLHSLWDSELIDHEGLNDEQIVNTYDKATDEQERKWQNDARLSGFWKVTKSVQDCILKLNLAKTLTSNVIKITSRQYISVSIRQG